METQKHGLQDLTIYAVLLALPALRSDLQPRRSRAGAPGVVSTVTG